MFPHFCHKECSTQPQKQEDFQHGNLASYFSPKIQALKPCYSDRFVYREILTLVHHLLLELGLKDEYFVCYGNLLGSARFNASRHPQKHAVILWHMSQKQLRIQIHGTTTWTSACQRWHSRSCSARSNLKM